MVTKEKPVSQVADVAEADTTVYEYKDLDNWAMFPDGDVQGVLKYVRDRVHYPDNVSADSHISIGTIRGVGYRLKNNS